MLCILLYCCIFAVQTNEQTNKRTNIVITIKSTKVMKVEVSVFKNQELVERTTVNGVKASNAVENKYRSSMTISQWVKENWAVFRSYPNK